MQPANQWLLDSDEPIIRYRTRTRLLGEPERSAAVRADRDAAARGPMVSGLLAMDDETLRRPYRKWSGLHWRLVALADLEVRTNATIEAGIDRELDWIADPRAWTRFR